MLLLNYCCLPPGAPQECRARDDWTAQVARASLTMAKVCNVKILHGWTCPIDVHLISYLFPRHLKDSALPEAVPAPVYTGSTRLDKSRGKESEDLSRGHEMLRSLALRPGLREFRRWSMAEMEMTGICWVCWVCGCFLTSGCWAMLGNVGQCWAYLCPQQKRTSRFMSILNGGPNLLDPAGCFWWSAWLWDAVRL